MSVWLVDADVLARSRFAVSALCETLQVLMDLPGDIAQEPLARELWTAVRASGWIPDLLSSPPRRHERTFAQELARMRTRRSQAYLDDLAVTCGGVRTGLLAADDVVDCLADLAERVWVEHVEPDWERRRKAFEADIVSRTHRISQDGWATAISGMSPKLSWLGEGQLRVNSWPSPPRDLRGADLVFVPTSTRGGWVSWELPGRYAVIYPAAGLLVPEQVVPSDAVARLIGRTRAGVLEQLKVPRSTSQLVATTGLALGSVGDHLRVLLDARLVVRRRAGTSVLYQQSALAEELLSAP